MSEATLKILNAKKETLYLRIQKLYNNSKNVDKEEELKNFKIRYETLEETKKEFDEIIGRINELEISLDKNYVPNFQPIEVVDELYCYIQSVAKNLLKKENTQSVTLQNAAAQTQKPSVKLPKVELPTFSGEQAEWPFFFHSYLSLIHNNAEIEPINKLHFLLGKLSGKALTVCSGITPNADNYSIIWKALVDKYEDKRALSCCYMDQIINFKQAQSENLHSLNAFLEKFDTSVKALKNLEIPNLSDFMLSYIALSKLDKDTLKTFEMSRRNKSQPTYQEVVDFVRGQSKILSFSDRSKRNISGTSNVNFNKQKSDAPSKLTHSFVINSKSSEDSRQLSCTFCRDSHQLFSCEKFLKLIPRERFNFAKDKNLCVNCLSSLHKTNACKSKNSCRTCANRHHTLLHWSSTPQSNYDNNNSNNLNLHNAENKEQTAKNSTVSDKTVSLCSTTSDNNSIILLSTAKVLLIGQNNKAHLIRVLIDNASQSCFLTAECCKKFKLPIQEYSSTVTGIGVSTQKITGRTKGLITSRFDANCQYFFDALVVEKITDKMPSRKADLASFEFLNGLPIADDTFATPGPIDGILGAEIFGKIMGPQKFSGQYDNVYAFETTLGYIIAGKAEIENSIPETQTFCSFVEPIDHIVKKFWQLEEIETPPPPSQEDEECEQFFISTYNRDESGRYIVRLPFTKNPDVLGDSYTIALKRFLALEKRFASYPQFKKLYVDAMQEQIDHGYMSRISEDKPPTITYYIPHHGVFKPESTSTPFRIVLDASAKTSSGCSLNEILHKGPKLQSDVINVLLNFRLFKIAITGDLRKMFFQIKLSPEDTRFQRILWKSSDETIDTYEINRVAFGLKSSPYLALRTIKQLAIDESKSFPEASKTVLNGNIYMDDLVCSIQDLSHAKNLYCELIQLFKAGGFHLTKWCSNSPELLQIIPENDLLYKPLTFNENVPKVLGLEWDPKDDTLGFKIQTPEINCTKRNILSTIARFYDPLGFSAPVIFFAKLLIKELWSLKLEWDDDAPLHIKKLWLQLYEELHLLAKFRVPRHLFVFENNHVDLIGFADASEKGYGGIVFIRVKSPDNTVKVSLVSAKSKVAPMKTVSIPRLELQAALLLAKLLHLIYEIFNTRIDIKNIFAFSDSTVALHWIHGTPSQFKTFIANRVSKIQSLLPAVHWLHIKGEDNPSDCLSRGLTPAQLINHTTWLTGPSWLTLDESLWPIANFVEDQDFVLEKKKTFCAVVTEKSENTILDLIDRVSDWNKLLKTVIFVLRFCKLLPKASSISATDLETAELFLSRVVQRSCFQNEFDLIEADNFVPSLQNLKPFLHNGLIRVGGRLSNSNLSFDQQHPILLPKAHPFVNLLIDYYHKKYLHAGPHLLVSLLRQKYWILSARTIVRKRIHLCNLCFRAKPSQKFPLMADLPAPRVREAKAFCHTGVDYGGPYIISLSRRRGAKSQKAYICLFVCFATRALHLELASDLSTDTFLAAFKRFLARRGPCSVMYSDMGTNFQGAKNALDSFYEFVHSSNYLSALKRELADNRIEWKFNPPASPHMGGIWERAIGSVKTHLAKVIGSQILTYEEFSTVLTQIECLLNSRPLCWLSCDPSEPLALTPAHFLTLTPLKFLPAEDLTETPINRLSRKELLDQIVQSYWKRWSLEYLNSLQTRQKWNTPSCPVTPGTVVIVRQDHTPPLSWPLGVIQEVFPGKDKIIRVATVKTKDGVYKRPVVKLCPLPNQ